MKARVSPRILSRHSRERGVTVFVVMMAVFLLTALGSWVIYAGGLAASASGYQRAASQSLYVAELGIVGGTGYLAQPGFAAANYAQAAHSLALNTPDDCQSVPDSTSRQFCKSIYMQEIDTAVSASSGGQNVLDLALAEGSMGPFANTLQGDFVLEMTDPRPVFVQGTDVNRQSYQKVTLTSYGMVRPQSANLCAGAAGQNSTASVVGMRAHAIIGPLN